MRLVNALEGVEDRCIAEYGGLPETEPRICGVLRAIVERRLVEDRDRLLAEVGNECPTFQSVPFAIAAFLRCRSDFRTGILEAINDGGDADSVASMVGAALGAHLGLSAIPADWIRPEDEDAARLARKLVASVA
jgi:ADP-ribosylglycohydrolase